MDFFGDYSIETASCHPSSLNNYEDGDVFTSREPFKALGPLSPCDTRTSYPVEFANMSNLARMFNLQKLETPKVQPPSEITSEYTHTALVSEDETSESTTRRMGSSSPRTQPCWRRRIQRQRDIHLLADPSHLRSISELVERMVDEGNQCEAIQRPRPTIISTTPALALAGDDEEDSEASELSSPRSLSGSSSNGRSLSYFESTSPQHRRSHEYTSSSISRDGRIQKSRSRRSYGRERR